MTSREKAIKILGHQPHCMDEREKYAELDIPSYCCCDYPLHILIAAERGKLREEHDFEVCEWGRVDWRCCNCDLHTPLDQDTPDGPCAEPLTPALAWELVVSQRFGLKPMPRGNSETAPVDWYADAWIPWGVPRRHEMSPPCEKPEDAVFALWGALAEANLLRRDDAMSD